MRERLMRRLEEPTKGGEVHVRGRSAEQIQDQEVLLVDGNQGACLDRQMPPSHLESGDHLIQGVDPGHVL